VTEVRRALVCYRGELLRRAARFDGDAEDLVQDVAERALTSEHTYKAGTNVRAWLHEILANVAADRGRRATCELRALRRMARVSETASHQPSILMRSMEARLAALPKGQRRTLILTAIYGFTCEEVERMHNVRRGTVLSRAARAREALRAA